MMGVSHLTVVDGDTIEDRNTIAKGMFFDDWHINDYKARALKQSIEDINPETEVNPIAENINSAFFKSDEIWESQDIILGGVSSLKEREKIDAQCVLNLKSWFDSGSLGAKGNTQSILPYITECYRDSTDEPEEQFPIDKIRNFPDNYWSCLDYAKSTLRDNIDTLNELREYLTDQTQFTSKHNTDSLIH